MTDVHDTEFRLRRLVERTTYKPKTGFRVTIKGECVFVQHWQAVADCKTGKPSFQKGRKFYVSPHMTDDEIIRTLALSVKLFEEHEANEWLKFDGERVLNPHPEGARPPMTILGDMHYGDPGLPDSIHEALNSGDGTYRP